ncbi:hypothetical protein [Kaarinaea lacus]
MEQLDEMFRQQTPMSVLFSTPDATSIIAARCCVLYPVASAGCANRPLPRGVGSFKLQFQSTKEVLCLPQFMSGRSCYLKEIKNFLLSYLIPGLVIARSGIAFRNPDAGVAS